MSRMILATTTPVDLAHQYALGGMALPGLEIHGAQHPFMAPSIHS